MLGLYHWATGADDCAAGVAKVSVLIVASAVGVLAPEGVDVGVGAEVEVDVPDVIVPAELVGSVVTPVPRTRPLFAGGAVTARDSPAEVEMATTRTMGWLVPSETVSLSTGLA